MEYPYKNSNKRVNLPFLLTFCYSFIKYSQKFVKYRCKTWIYVWTETFVNLIFSLLQTLQFHTLSLKFALSCLNPTFHPSFCRHGRAGRAFVCYLLYKQVYGRFQLRNTLDLCIWYKYINDFILFNLSILCCIGI